MRAKVKFDVQRWSGWTKEQPEGDSFDFEVIDGETLVVNPKILKQKFEDPFYTVKVNVLDLNQVKVIYKGLVLTNKNGITNLKNQSNGELDLSTGQSAKFSSSTMDAGVNVVVTLNEIK